MLAEIEERYNELQRQLEARVHQLLSGNEDEPELEPDPEGFVPNKLGLGFRYKEEDANRPMVRLARGFTPEARAKFVQKNEKSRDYYYDI